MALTQRYVPLILALFLIGGLPGVAGQPTENLSDGFGDDTIGQAPSGAWYTHASNGAPTSDVQDGGDWFGQYWRFSDSNSAATAHLAFGSVDACDASSVSWAFRVSALPASGSRWLTVGGIYDTQNADGLGDAAQTRESFSVFLTDTGALRLKAITLDGVPSIKINENTFATSISINTWYNITLSNINCGAGSVTGTLVDQSDSVSVDTADGDIDRTDFFSVGSYGGGQPTGTLRIDNVALNGVPAALTPADASLTLANVKGADVDDTGRTFIVRHGSGGNTQVSTYGAEALTLRATTANTNCDMTNGVAAHPLHVAYLTCQGAGTQDAVFVQSAALGAPNVGDCQNCDTVFLNSRWPVDITRWSHMESTQIFRYDYQTILLGKALMSVGYYTTDGYVGIASFRTGFGQTSYATEELVDAGEMVLDSMCIARNGDTHYIFGATDQEDVKAWTFTYGLSGNSLTVSTAALVLDGAGDTGLVNGVDCHQDKYATMKSNGTLTYYQFGSTTPIWRIDGITSPSTDCLDISPDGRFLAYCANNGDVRVLHASNGTEITRIIAPQGTVYRMEMDGNANSLWYVFDGGARRYSIWSLTTGAETAWSQDPVDATADAGGDPLDGGIFDGMDDTFGDAFGIGATGGATFIGFIFIIALALGGVTVVPDNRVLGGAIGGVLGIMVAWTFGVLSPVFLFVLVVLTAGAVAGLLFLGRGSSV